MKSDRSVRHIRNVMIIPRNCFTDWSHDEWRIDCRHVDVTDSVELAETGKDALVNLTIVLINCSAANFFNIYCSQCGITWIIN